MRKAERRSEFYTHDKNLRDIRRPHHLYIFNEEDLDNDEIIAMVEDTPTYKRSKEVLNSIKGKSNQNCAFADAVTAEGNDEEKSMIVF